MLSGWTAGIKQKGTSVTLFPFWSLHDEGDGSGAA
jgi:hypothetical protein